MPAFFALNMGTAAFINAAFQVCLNRIVDLRSTFSCGDVYSPTLAPNTADVLVVMEVSEILRPGFIDLLKPEGTIILNDYVALPPKASINTYPQKSAILKLLANYKLQRF